MTDRRAVIAGATGLVGRHCLELLLDESVYTSVIALSRRPVGQASSRLEEKLIDFDDLSSAEVSFDAADVFCCLGTTLKTAGSREAFRKVDFDYVVNLATLARDRGARQFLMVSAIGASARSLAFYNRVKGEAEQAVSALKLPALHIFQPSLLTGDRREFRLAERITTPLALAVSPLLAGPLKCYRPVAAATVARRMVDVAGTFRRGRHVHTF